MAKQRGSMFTAVVFDVLAHSGEEVEVFRVFARPHFLFAQRVGADEFVGGALEVAQLKLRLAEPQMQKGVADGIWAVHRVTEGVAGGFVAAAQKFGVAHRSQYPSGGFPFGLRFGQQIPCLPKTFDGFGIALRIGQLVALFAQRGDLPVDMVVQFGQGRLLL